MHGLACDSKTPGCLPFADSFHIHRAPHGCVEFHSVHLSVRPHHGGFLPGGSLFRRPEAALPRRSLVYFCSAAYTISSARNRRLLPLFRTLPVTKNLTFRRAPIARGSYSLPLNQNELA